MTAAGANENRIVLSDRKIGILLWLLFFGVGLIFGLQLNVPPVLDEVGILANSAYMDGYDWSETVYTMGGYYYKYGISLLFAPFLKLIDNPYAVYKAIMVFNMAVYAFIPVFSYRILKNHLGASRIASVLMALASGIIPSCFLYQLYAKADSMLIFLPWAVTLILLELEKTEKDNKRKRIFLSVLLSFVSVYAFTVHTRGLVVIIATAMTVILVRVIAKKKLVNLIAYISSSIVFLLLDRLLSDFFYKGVYSIYGTGHASAESFDFEYLKKIFSKEGFLSIIKLATGWLYDGLSTTYGIIAIAVICGVIIIFKSKRSEQITFALFAVLNFLGAFGMGILFFFPPANKYYIGESVVRADRLIYDRYMAAGYGPLLLLGLYILIVRRDIVKNWIKAVCAVAYAIVFVGFIVKCASYLEGVTGCARYYISMCTFLDVNGGSTFAAFENIKDALLYAGLLDAGIFIVLLAVSSLVKKEKLRGILLTGVFIIVSTVITIICYEKIRVSRDDLLYRQTKEPVELMLQLEDFADDYPVLWENSAKDIKHYQFLLKEFVIGSYCTDSSKAENCFIISRRNRFIKEYYNKDYYIFEDFDYAGSSKDMVYVKGKELADKLTAAGFKMTKYKGKFKAITLPSEKQDFISAKAAG